MRDDLETWVVPRQEKWPRWEKNSKAFKTPNMARSSGPHHQEQHASADHDRHIPGERDRAGEQIFHVFDIGITLDDFDRDLLCHSA